MKETKKIIPTVLKEMETKYGKAKNPQNFQIPVRKFRSVKGLTRKYKIFHDRDKFKSDKKPVIFFDSIDISDEYYFKYKNKEYQNILMYGIKGNGKSFAIQWFMEKYCKKYNCKNIYITMTDFIETLHSLDLKTKRDFTENILNTYNVICIDEIDKFGVTDYVDRTIFNFLDRGNNNMNKFIFGSNLNKNKLQEKVGENIMSRIEGDCLIIENKGELLR